MKIAFLTDGKFPVPATKGGAVENLIEDLLNENEKEHHMDFSVLSVYEEQAYIKSNKYKWSDFYFVKCPKIVSWLDKCTYWIAKRVLHRKNLISYRYIFQRIFVMSKYPAILKKHDFDRIVLVTNSTLFLVLKNKKLAKKYENKVIYYLHNEVRSIFKCEKEVASIHSLIGVSKFVNNSFKSLMPNLNDNQCFVLKNGIDTNRFFSKDERKINVFRAKFGLKQSDFVVIFAGRLVDEKGALETIKAIKKCNDKDIKLLIVGGGFYSSDIVDDYMIALRNEANGIEDRIIFTGYIDYDDMPIIYHLGNVAVLPSMWDEPAGMTMVEAVISGLPLITTYSGGIPEYIPDKLAFILYRDNKLIDKIAELIIKLKNKEIALSTESSCLNSLINELNLESYYKRFCELCTK